MLWFTFFYLIWYLINSGKLLSENPQAHPEKVHSPLKSASPPLFDNIENVSAPPPPPRPPPPPPLCRKGGGGGHYVIAILKNQNKSKIKKIEISRLSIFRVELMFFVFTYKSLYAVVFLAGQSVLIIFFKNQYFCNLTFAFQTKDKWYFTNKWFFETWPKWLEDRIIPKAPLYSPGCCGLFWLVLAGHFDVIKWGFLEIFSHLWEIFWRYASI